ncbi:Cyclic-di-GMP-binding biofilm dispersal mediator protein [compost metagenome]|jgi:NAD(P)-dependent dehydrogenase (short-subunit alcohol dehydrogenase family)
MNPDGGPVSEIVGPGIAIGRYGKPEDIASVVAFLASPEAAFVTAADIIADGGFTA